MTAPVTHSTPTIEAAISVPTLHLLLYAGLAVFALVAVASLAVPVLDAVRRWVRDE